MSSRPPAMVTEPAGHRPAQQLWIYHLEGRLPRTGAPRHPDFIGAWQEAGSLFLFFRRPAAAVVQALAARHPDLAYRDAYQMSWEQWHGGPFEPFARGGVRVVPAWRADAREAAQAAETRTVLLDPGVVFGAGTHPTTRHCLAALAAACRPPVPAAALDLGTGTGLLALAAARLGCRRVAAVDVNALAAATARDNVVLNGLQDSVMVVQADAVAAAAWRAGLVIANLHHDVMRRLIDAPGFQEKERFVLSGLLPGEARDIAGQLERRGVRVERRWVHDGIWHTFYARRRR